MKKAFCSVILIVLFILPLMAEKPVTAVLDFQTNNISQGDMRSIISFLSAELFATGKYRVIDTAQRETILSELEFSASGCTDEACQLEIGKLLSAEYIVTGDIAVVGNRFILSARMLETETSETSSIARGIYTSIDELIDDMPGFAVRLAENSEAAAVEETPVQSSEPEPAAVVTEENPEAEIPPDVVTPAEPRGKRTFWSWSTLGAGAAAAGIGGYLLYAAFDYKATVVDPAYTAYSDATANPDETSIVEYYDTLWNAYETSSNEFLGKTLLASALTGAGLISLGVSMYLFFTDGSEAAEYPVVVFRFIPGPAAAVLSCSFRY